MTWLRRVLIAIRPRSFTRTQSPEIAQTQPHFEATIRKADRVIAQYRRYDGLLKVTVKR